MKLKDGFILHSAGEDHVVVATGEASKSFQGLIRNNCTAAFLFENLLEDTTEEELVQALLYRYDVGRQQARKDVHELIENISEAGILEG